MADKVEHWPDIPDLKLKNFDRPALLIGYHFQSYLHLKV